MSALKILVIPGSLRTGSHNARLAAAAAHELAQAGAEALVSNNNIFANGQNGVMGYMGAGLVLRGNDIAGNGQTELAQVITATRAALASASA